MQLVRLDLTSHALRGELPAGLRALPCLEVRTAIDKSLELSANLCVPTLPVTTRPLVVETALFVLLLTFATVPPAKST